MREKKLGAMASVAGKLFHGFIVLGKKAVLKIGFHFAGNSKGLA